MESFIGSMCTISTEGKQPGIADAALLVASSYDILYGSVCIPPWVSTEGEHLVYQARPLFHQTTFTYSLHTRKRGLAKVSIDYF